MAAKMAQTDGESNFDQINEGEDFVRELDSDIHPETAYHVVKKRNHSAVLQGGFGGYQAVKEEDINEWDIRTI